MFPKETKRKKTLALLQRRDKASWSKACSGGLPEFFNKRKMTFTVELHREPYVSVFQFYIVLYFIFCRYLSDSEDAFFRKFPFQTRQQVIRKVFLLIIPEGIDEPSVFIISYACPDA